MGLSELFRGLRAAGVEGWEDDGYNVWFDAHVSKQGLANALIRHDAKKASKRITNPAHPEIAEEFSEDGSPVADRMRLNEREMLALTGCLLFIMNADIDAHRDDGYMAQRLSEREQVRDQLRNRKDVLTRLDNTLDIEERETLFALLGSLDDLAHELSMIVDLVVYEPWSNVKRMAASEQARRLAVRDICRNLGRSITSSETDLVEDELQAGLQASRSYKGIAVGVAIAGLALALTGGLAAPLIGGMIGGMGGLVGAAAVAHGLALLGGGAVATGGFGMVGGTLLLTGLGGAFGAGTAALALSPQQASAEAVKSFALVQALRRHGCHQEASLCISAFRSETERIGSLASAEAAKPDGSRDNRRVKELEHLRDSLVRLCRALPI